MGREKDCIGEDHHSEGIITDLLHDVGDCIDEYVGTLYTTLDKAMETLSA